MGSSVRSSLHCPVDPQGHLVKRGPHLTGEETEAQGVKSFAYDHSACGGGGWVVSVHSPIFELLDNERRETGGGEERERLDKCKMMPHFGGLSGPPPTPWFPLHMCLSGKFSSPISQAISGPGCVTAAIPL